MFKLFPLEPRKGPTPCRYCTNTIRQRKDCSVKAREQAVRSQLILGCIASVTGKHACCVVVFLKEDSACPHTQIAGLSRPRSEDRGHYHEIGLLLLTSAQTQTMQLLETCSSLLWEITMIQRVGMQPLQTRKKETFHNLLFLEVCYVMGVFNLNQTIIQH